MSSVKITCRQYLIIQALFNILEIDTRASLNKVFYDITNDTFNATDGHILRQEKIEWLELEGGGINKPAHSFLINRFDLQLTKKQLREKYGSHFEGVVIVLMYEAMGTESYPDYKKVIPTLETTKPLEGIGIEFEYFEKFKKSIYGLSHSHFFLQFTGEKKPILVFYKTKKACALTDPRIFAGVIMPIDLKYGPESKWEIKPKEEEDFPLTMNPDHVPKYLK